MYMYLVEECVDKHTGKMEMIAIFFKKEDAFKFVKDNIWFYNSWFSGKPISGLKVTKVER